MAQRRGDWDYLSTCCRHTGAPCGPGLTLARQLTDCLDRGGTFIPDGFELTGLARLDDCGRTCPLTFRVAKRGAWVLGDVERGPNPDALMAFAESFFESSVALPRPPASPAAMVRAALHAGRAPTARVLA